MSQITGRDLWFDLCRARYAFPKWAAIPLMYALGALTVAIMWHRAPVALGVALLVGAAASVAALRYKRVELAGWVLAVWAGAAVTVVCRWADWGGAAWQILYAGLAVTLYGGVHWLGRHVVTPGSSKRLLARMSEHSQHNEGVADWTDIQQRLSAKALRLRGRHLRPSMARLTKKEIKRKAVTEFGAMVLYLGLRWRIMSFWPGRDVHVDAESVTGLVAPPRSGKTALLACMANDVPGALIMTSTRPDLAEWAHKLRAARGAVMFWNPSDLLDVPSTIHGGPDHGEEVAWPVLAGCEVYSTALRRAENMIPGNGDRDSARWDQAARALLAVLLHAAALGGYTMLDVQRWVNDETGENGHCASLVEIEEALAKVKAGSTSRISTARQHYLTNGNTRTSVTFTLRTQALDWLNNDKARALAAGPVGRCTLNLDELVRKGWTLCILGRDEGVGPLNACLVGEIGHVARMIAARMPNQRLDPYLTFLLDEAAIACPVPLDSWTSDMGGSGIMIVYSVQSLAQLEGRYGAHKARAIKSNTNNLMYLGGGNDPEELAGQAKLSGQVMRDVLDGEGEEKFRTATIDEAMQRSMPQFMAVLYARNTRPIIGWTPRVWDRDGIVRIPLGEAAQDVLGQEMTKDVEVVAKPERPRRRLLPFLARREGKAA